MAESDRKAIKGGKMKNLIEQAEAEIKELLDSDLTSYQIGKRSGVSFQAIDNYRKGANALENMTFKTAKKLLKLKEEEMKMKKIELTEKDFDGINELSFRKVAQKFNISPAAAKSMVGDYNTNGFSENLNFYVNTPQNIVAFTKGEYEIG